MGCLATRGGLDPRPVWRSVNDTLGASQECSWRYPCERLQRVTIQRVDERTGPPFHNRFQSLDSARVWTSVLSGYWSDFVDILIP
jgi:hypothetical protein